MRSGPFHCVILSNLAKPSSAIYTYTELKEPSQPTLESILSHVGSAYLALDGSMSRYHHTIIYLEIVVSPCNGTVAANSKWSNITRHQFGSLRKSKINIPKSNILHPNCRCA